MTLAGLPMYDLPELRAAHDAWWRGLRGHLRAAGFAELPEALDRSLPAPALWRDPALLLAQCCGYDLRLGDPPLPCYLATPHYDLPGCEGPLYCSFLVVREEEEAEGLADLRGQRAAVNMAGSHSGQNVLRYMVSQRGAARPFFGEVLESGGHRASLAAVREGRADLAAIDCVTFGLIARAAPGEVAALRVLERSPAVPGLPYVTAPGTDAEKVAALQSALLAAVEDAALAEARAALALSGFSLLSAGDYDPLVEMAGRAEALGQAPLLP